jgi:hypothetical protein
MFDSLTCQALGLSNRRQLSRYAAREGASMENHDAACFALENSLRRVIWLVRLSVRTCTHQEVLQ